MSKKELTSVEAEVLVNKKEYMIKRNLKSFRVTISPPNNPKETGVTFHFIPGDYASEVRALKQAIKYRNETLLLGETNTGYKGIRIVDSNNDGLLINVNKMHNRVPINKDFLINSKTSCSEALRQAISYLTSKMGIGLPELITYDYTLYEAYKRGYTAREGENVTVSPRLYVGAIIECPKTKREGVVRAIYDDVSIWVSFREGNPFETIINETLYYNRINEQVKIVENLHAKLSVHKHTDSEKNDIYNTIEDIINNMPSIYKKANKNKDISKDIVIAKKVINVMRPKITIRKVKNV